MKIREEVLNVLKSIIHPEYGEDIVTNGMVGALEVDDIGVTFALLIKRPKDPFAQSIKKICEQKIEFAFPQYKDKIEISIEAPVRPPSAKSAAKAAPKIISTDNGDIKNIIAISSGKGGVGKSTVTANLAVQLAKMGYSVGLIDADIYGPSQPKMFGLEGEAPQVIGEEGAEQFIPLERYGVKLISIGFFIKVTDALVWRGPIATNALRQILHQTAWGKLDYLLIDLPPGTGDIHLTLLAEMKLTGAVIVSTPQQVALADVIRGIEMFKSPKIDVPILGIVENMAWFTPAELPNNKYYIFGKGGAVELAKEQGVELLAQIPLVQSLCEGGDSGTPDSLQTPVSGLAYMELALNIEKLSNK